MARQFKVARAVVSYWLLKAGDLALDQVDWSDQPPGPRCPANRTKPPTEDLILQARHDLRASSDLGNAGADAIMLRFRELGLEPPARATISRILVRRGALDGQRRVRRAPPPRGWYLPKLMSLKAELDSWDYIEDLKLKDGPLVQVLNVVAIHGGQVGSWCAVEATTSMVLHYMDLHWQKWGLPDYAQFDNDLRFQGPHQHPDAVGRVIRHCWALGVIPVFATPREQGFQNAVESYNGRWENKVWHRFDHPDLAALQACSERFVTACQAHTQSRRELAPARRAWPAHQGPTPALAGPRTGTIIFLRRSNEDGVVSLLGRQFLVHPSWQHRLVRAEVDMPGHIIHFYTLRRKAPSEQPLVNSLPYFPVNKAPR